MGKPPKMRITKIRAVLMLFVATIFSIVIFIFATFPISAPIMLAGVTDAVVTNRTDSSVIGSAAGVATGISAGAVEFVTGVGAVAIATFGEITADSFEFLALALVFPFWYLLSGIKQLSGENATKRFFIVMTGLIAGLIPIINILPTVLISVSLIIFSVRKEDAIKIKAYKQSNETRVPRLKRKSA